MVRDLTAFHNPYYEENLYGPAKDELFVEQLNVIEGHVPNDIYGAYIRNGPNPKQMQQVLKLLLKKISQE